MCELGAQNLYLDFDMAFGSVAKDHFKQLGIIHHSYDIRVHQGADYIDLREPLEDYLIDNYDVVTDFGTSEHCDGNYYQVNKNIHDLCKVGGLIIRENPKTGHWPNHGHNYIDMGFYVDLAAANGYEILDLCEEFAMGNTIDGGNICVVLRKASDKPFMSETKFKKLHYYAS